MTIISISEVLEMRSNDAKIYLKSKLDEIMDSEGKIIAVKKLSEPEFNEKLRRDIVRFINKSIA